MIDVKQAKLFGGIGTIMIMLGPIPYIGWIAAVVGLILLGISLSNLATVTGDRSIFTNFVISLVVGIVGGVFVLFLFFGAGLTGLSTLGALGGGTTYILSVICAYFMSRTYRTLGTRLSTALFNTAATLCFWGAVGILAFGIGLVAILVANILLIVAFFSIPDSLPSVIIGNDLTQD